MEYMLIYGKTGVVACHVVDVGVPKAIYTDYGSVDN